MALLPSTQLHKSYKINHDGQSSSGPLVADDKGIGVDVSTSEKKSILKKQTITRRYYVVLWEKVTGYEIGRPAQSMFAGSSINDNEVIFTVKTAANQHAFQLPSTGEVWLRNKLGPYLAAVDNRN